MSAKPQSKFSLVDPATLTIHPALRDLPAWADDDPQFESFIRDIQKRGFDVPLKIDSKHRVVDGRHRLRAARRLKLSEVPCELVPDAHVPDLVLHYILQRRHYPKGALAYMSVPLIADDSRSLDSIAQEFGFSRQTLQQAIEIHSLFNRTGEYTSAPQDLVTAFKAEVEPRILSGEAGLGGVLAGWSGFISTRGKAKSVRSALDLWDRSFTDLQRRFSTWNKFDSETKSSIAARLAPLVESMPDDLLAKLSQRAAAELKNRKAEK